MAVSSYRNKQEARTAITIMIYEDCCKKCQVQHFMEKKKEKKNAFSGRRLKYFSGTRLPF